MKHHNSVVRNSLVNTPKEAVSEEDIDVMLKDGNVSIADNTKEVVSKNKESDGIMQNYFAGLAFYSTFNIGQ